MYSTYFQIKSNSLYIIFAQVLIAQNQVKKTTHQSLLLHALVRCLYQEVAGQKKKIVSIMNTGIKIAIEYKI